jgi:hypothetical protein
MTKLNCTPGEELMPYSEEEVIAVFLPLSCDKSALVKGDSFINYGKEIQKILDDAFAPEEILSEDG